MRCLIAIVSFTNAQKVNNLNLIVSKHSKLTQANKRNEWASISQQHRDVLTVDFLSVFVAKHAIIIQLLLSDVYFVLGWEGFRERTNSFCHFVSEKVPPWYYRLQNVCCGKIATEMSTSQSRPPFIVTWKVRANHDMVLVSRGNPQCAAFTAWG